MHYIVCEARHPFIRNAVGWPVASWRRVKDEAITLDWSSLILERSGTFMLRMHCAKWEQCWLVQETEDGKPAVEGTLMRPRHLDRHRIAGPMWARKRPKWERCWVSVRGRREFAQGHQCLFLKLNPEL